MIKRYQILLNDWLGDHLSTIAKKYDISMSEATRLVLCLQVPKLASIVYSKIKPAALDKKLVTTIKKYNNNKASRMELHKLISDIYFEARKALETWTVEENKRKKKK